ncbi:thiamine phosphate synthase [Campylobacter troglodytis]|uniref:thiamine phosphate synthase n=1 Tax=Campylobacter troglodytis TaxID=654363 RepID=UPI00115BC3A2|nr:thiamine phosphate synthase [Campylobacter troglodytis]TQR53078.1 thiamine phosphate synthase [Campylobacter troglodytis]
MIDLSLYLVASLGKNTVANFLNIVENAIKGGVSVVQLREKNLNSREFYTLALALKALCDELKTPLIINDRLDIALAVNATGVHLGQEDLPISLARKILGEDKIIGLSAKTPLELENCDGADYVGCGAVFESPTKDSSVIGVAGLKALCEKSPLPVVAIGGINEGNVCELKGCKIVGIAVSSAIMRAKNPLLTSKNLKKEFDKFSKG